MRIINKPNIREETPHELTDIELLMTMYYAEGRRK